MILDLTRDNITNEAPDPADVTIKREDTVFDIVDRRLATNACKLKVKQKKKSGARTT